MVANPQPPIIFDTVAFIDFGERLYPPDVFGALWTLLLETLKRGEIVTTRRVLTELSNVPNPQQWRKDVHAACLPLVIDESLPAIQGVFARLAGLVQAKQLSSQLSDTDLFVLCCGEVTGFPIVTRDTKMIRACNMGFVVATPIDVVQVFRVFGWSFP